MIGRYLYKVSFFKKLNRILHFIFGTLDIHTHIRVKPLLKFMKLNTYIFKNNIILEIGCGQGLNLFETYYMVGDSVEAIGVDIDENSIFLANKIAYDLKLNKNLRFYCVDVCDDKFIDLISNISVNRVTVLYLIDFIEHINNPDIIFEKIFSRFKNIQYVFVSVPTNLYKKVFGEKFHLKVGHVKDGYTLDEIKYLFSKFGFDIFNYEYNTGLVSNIACSIYYRTLPSNKYLRVLLFILLFPFVKLDLLNNEKISSSLFVVLKKHGASKGF